MYQVLDHEVVVFVVVVVSGVSGVSVSRSIARLPNASNSGERARRFPASARRLPRPHDQF